MLNELEGMRCFISGPIDRVDDDGVGWRNETSHSLSSLTLSNIEIFNQSI